MPKLDKQGRITIPLELRQEIGLSSLDEIAICYDFSNDIITICNKQNIADNCVIAFRKLDKKGRFVLPNDVLNLLGISKNDLIIIFLQNDKLCIKGMGETGI